MLSFNFTKYTSSIYIIWQFYRSLDLICSWEIMLQHNSLLWHWRLTHESYFIISCFAIRFLFAFLSAWNRIKCSKYFFSFFIYFTIISTFTWIFISSTRKLNLLKYSTHYQRYNHSIADKALGNCLNMLQQFITWRFLLIRSMLSLIFSNVLKTVAKFFYRNLRTRFLYFFILEPKPLVVNVAYFTLVQLKLTEIWIRTHETRVTKRLITIGYSYFLSIKDLLVRVKIVFIPIFCQVVLLRNFIITLKNIFK